MPWAPCNYYEHEWKPIPAWGMRRKCPKCYTIGYLGSAIPEAGLKKAWTVYEYKCPRCHNPTTLYKRGASQPCLNCRPVR
jgi:phage FluMu protein Com